MTKRRSRILTVFFIISLSLICTCAAYASDDAGAAVVTQTASQTATQTATQTASQTATQAATQTATQAPQNASLKVYSKDSSQGKVVGGGTLTVDANAYVTALGNRLDIEGVKNYIYVQPSDGYVFDGWDNLPQDSRVQDGAVILAKFRPVGLDTVSNVTASVAKESKDMGSIVPTSKIKVLTNAEVQVLGSTVLIAREAFSAIPKKGKVFSHWEGLPEGDTILGDIAITAVFETPENPVTVSFAQPATGGSFVSTTGSTEITVPAGAEITINNSQICLNGTEYVMAVPYSGYEFLGWSGVPSGGVITADTVISAGFTPSPTEKKATYQYSTTDGEKFYSNEKYGDLDNPVNDGEWVRDNDSSWRYDWHVPMANSWGYIYNPYAHEDQPADGWFFFDRSGQMLTGWRIIDNKWYYFEPVSNGCKGQLYSGTTTPDGYAVDDAGARVEGAQE